MPLIVNIIYLHSQFSRPKSARRCPGSRRTRLSKLPDQENLDRRASLDCPAHSRSRRAWTRSVWYRPPSWRRREGRSRGSKLLVGVCRRRCGFSPWRYPISVYGGLKDSGVSSCIYLTRRKRRQQIGSVFQTYLRQSANLQPLRTKPRLHGTPARTCHL